MMEIISRSEARALGLTKYFTGKLCINGHISERYVHGACVECQTNKIAKRPTEYNTEYMQRWRENNPDAARIVNLKNTYGMTEDAYNNLLRKQGGVCAVCKVATVGSKNRKHLFVDHSHDEQFVRGLLCQQCNCMLGYAKDNPDVLHSGAEYLEGIETRRSESWIQTHSGKTFVVADPSEDSIDIRDIAAALSKQCRYAGHCIKPYSVAEHCVLMAEKAKPEHKLTALLHDASEAYLIDVPKPVKSLIVGYELLESNIMAKIAAKYKFFWPLPKEVKELDRRILSDERMQNMSPMEDGETWPDGLPPIGVTLKCWSPDQSYREFMDAFFQYGGIE